MNHNPGPEHYCPECRAHYVPFTIGGLLGGTLFLLFVYGAQAWISVRACARYDELYLSGTLEQSCTQLLVQRRYGAYASNMACRNIGVDLDGMKLLLED